MQHHHHVTGLRCAQHGRYTQVLCACTATVTASADVCVQGGDPIHGLVEHNVTGSCSAFGRWMKIIQRLYISIMFAVAECRWPVGNSGIMQSRRSRRPTRRDVYAVIALPAWPAGARRTRTWYDERWCLVATCQQLVVPVAMQAAAAKAYAPPRFWGQRGSARHYVTGAGGGILCCALRSTCQEGNAMLRFNACEAATSWHGINVHACIAMHGIMVVAACRDFFCITAPRPEFLSEPFRHTTSDGSQRIPPANSEFETLEFGVVLDFVNAENISTPSLTQHTQVLPFYHFFQWIFSLPLFFRVEFLYALHPI